MSIMTSISLQKADAVEIERRNHGRIVRWAAYALSIIFMVISSLLFYHYPSSPMLAFFVISHVGLIAALYFLLPMIVSTPQQDLVYDGQRLAWRQSFSEPSTSKEPIKPSHDFMSYSFI